MGQSAEIDKLATALCEFQKNVPAAHKQAINNYFKDQQGKPHRFADLEGIWEAIRKDLTGNGLSVTQPMGWAVVGDQMITLLKTSLKHISGQWEDGEMPLLLKSQDPQGQGSAISYARRYCLAAMLGIIQTDDDAERAQQPHREARAEVSGGSGTPASSNPPCPKCGTELRRGKDNPQQLYCWKAKGGCGYDSIRDGEDLPKELPQINEVAESSPKPVSSDAGSSKETVGKPVATTKAPSDHEWAELKRIGNENGWNVAFVKLQIEQRQRKGMKSTEIFSELWEQCTKPNPRAVAGEVIDIDDEELPF